MMLQTDIDIVQPRPTNSFSRSTDFAHGPTARRQPEELASSQAPPFHVARNETVQHTVVLPLMTQDSMTSNTVSHRFPPVTYSKVPSPSYDGAVPQGRHDQGAPVQERRGGQDGRVLLEGRGVQDGRETHGEQQTKAAASRKQLARRHLSNSLQGARSVLPVLRRMQSFNVPAHLNSTCTKEQPARPVVPPKRDTGSLGPRKPPHDLAEVRAGLRRAHSLREEASSSNESPQLLSLSLPQPTRAGNVSLAALVHELNATMHYPSSPSRRPSRDFSNSDVDDDTIGDFDYENGLDPDLCPRLTGQDTGGTPNRTLTPALRKLNRRKVSSRVRVQQWVNQIEEEEQRNERRKKVTEAQRCEKAQVSLIFEQAL